VAGTERGVTEPQATFSTCFGAPFMPRHPAEYGTLLELLIAEHGDQANWVQNLRANPQVHIRVAGSSMGGTARVMDAKAERILCRQIQARSEKKYGWGKGLIVEITPVGEEGADAARRPTAAHEM